MCAWQECAGMRMREMKSVFRLTAKTEPEKKRKKKSCDSCALKRKNGAVEVLNSTAPGWGGDISETFFMRFSVCARFL